MPSDSTIRSRAHPLIKRVGAVQSGHEAGMIVLEGDRLIDDAISAGLMLEAVLVADDRLDRAERLERARQPVKLVDAALLQRVSALKTSPGTLALCSAPSSVLIGDLDLAHNALVLIVAGVADPGNVGALARCAEAFGARAMIVARGGASPWNDKALRGSMGSLLRIPVSYGAPAEEIASALAARDMRQAIAATRGGKEPHQFDWSGPLALWITSETGALPAAAKDFEQITIPMTGRVESLNVTVAAALLLFASGRATSASVVKANKKEKRRA
jgi:TrmH family RNA methyltransferase